jgi:CelD/BcsL family acetyltransferase involved in cellulose biosynthesis
MARTKQCRRAGAVPPRIESVESPDALEALEPQWRELWQRDASATPFESPDWLLPWTRRLWGGGRLRVFAVRDGEDLVALAPLFFWGYGGRPEIIRVSFLGAGITDHLGMLAAPGFETAGARLVFERLAAIHGEWHLCELEELRAGSPLLRAELPPGMTARDAASGVCPVLTLPTTVDELLAGLQPKFRRNLRVAEERLLHEGAEFIPGKPDETAEIMRALFRLHAARWRERREPGMVASEALQQFHLEAAGRLAQHDLLRLFAIRLHGEIIAVQYNLRRADRVYCYLSGFDPAHARSSPGAALLAFAIRSALEEGAREVDFLRKREEFKYQWGAADCVNRRLILSYSAADVRDVA